MEEMRGELSSEASTVWKLTSKHGCHGSSPVSLVYIRRPGTKTADHQGFYYLPIHGLPGSCYCSLPFSTYRTCYLGKDLLPRFIHMSVHNVFGLHRCYLARANAPTQQERLDKPHPEGPTRGVKEMVIVAVRLFF